jgi:hypothetical protein
MRTAGKVILILGLIATGYGALDFFVIVSLPPNDPLNGRLPSLYLILAGIPAMLIGLFLGSVRPKKTARSE